MPSFEVGSSTDPMMGKLLEGYRIVRVVGQGGMGVVYEAVHESIGQRAAVKILFPEFSTDVQSVSRFLAEARAASKVQHGGLVKVFYSGRDDDGTAYIMMEFLDGESIEARLRRLANDGRRMDTVMAARITAQIASALGAVHAAGIVHRDMKPANVILVSDPEVEGGERIKVLDFGIAKFDSATTEISKTTVGRFLGTALYASPEQCQMAGEVGPHADVYSLGVMLYEMLAGRPPFVAEQPGMVIGMHLFMPPSPLYTIRPDTPEPLHALVHEMLAKAPQKRPSMATVGQRLQQVKHQAPGLLRRIRRERRLLASFGGVAALASAGLVWGVAGHTRQVQPLPVTTAGQTPERAGGTLPAASTSVAAAPVPAGLPAAAGGAPASAAPPVIAPNPPKPPSPELATSAAPPDRTGHRAAGKRRKGKAAAETGQGSATEPKTASGVRETTQAASVQAVTVDGASPPPAEPSAKPSGTPSPTATAVAPSKGRGNENDDRSPSKPAKADDGILR